MRSRFAMRVGPGNSAGCRSSVSEPLVLVFDGDCGFCTATAEWLQRLGQPARITAIPCQAERSVRSIGVSPGMCREAAVVVAPDGSHYQGAAAMTTALAYALDAHWLMGIAQVRPARWLARRVYQLLVRVRSWLPGITPFCQEHPDRCGETL